MRRITLASLLTLSLGASLAANSCGGGGGGGGGPTAPPTPRPPEVHIVQVRDFSYEPKSLTIEPGDTVRWVLGGSDHTHTVTARNGDFNSGVVFTSSGAMFERRFDQGGTWDYSCQAHKDCCGMQGSIRVGNNSPPPGVGYE